jgi:hypothetical protein
MFAKTKEEQDVYVLVPRSQKGAVTSALIGDVVSNASTPIEEKKEEKKELIQAALPLTMLKGHPSAKGRGQVTVLLPGTLTGLSLASGTASAKIPWSPLSIGEFAAFAALFTEYSVKEVRTHFWFDRSTTNAVSTSFFIIAEDPGGVMSGTPTFSTVPQFLHCERWLPAVTDKVAPCFTVAKPSKASGAYAQGGGPGYLPVATVWNGQTIFVVGAGNGSSTNVALQYQTEYVVTFRFRS